MRKTPFLLFIFALTLSAFPLVSGDAFQATQNTLGSKEKPRMADILAPATCTGTGPIYFCSREVSVVCCPQAMPGDTPECFNLNRPLQLYFHCQEGDMRLPSTSEADESLLVWKDSDPPHWVRFRTTSVYVDGSLPACPKDTLNLVSICADSNNAN